MKKTKMFKVAGIVLVSVFLAVNLIIGNGTLKKSSTDVSLSTMTKISVALAQEAPE